MAYFYDVPNEETKKVNSIEIVAFAVDLDREEIYVTYKELDIDEEVVGELTHTFSGIEYTNLFTNASIAAQGDISVIIKTAIYSEAAVRLNKEGVTM